jgi:glutamine amidotransferase
MASRDAEIAITKDAEVLSRADMVVVPGQGGFGDCARALAGGMGEAVKAQIAKGTPYLGICLGMQVLFATSEEAPGCAGLDVFAGAVRRLASGVDEAGLPLKIPHIGWNTVERRRGTILPGVPTHYYFVHGYVVVPDDPSVVCGETEYGARFVSAVEKDNVLAVQFHPEKSQSAGLELLARFLST